MKKKIDWLIVIPHDTIGGGSEQLLYNLTEYFSNQGAKCCVVFLSKKSGAWEDMEQICEIRYSYFNNVYLGYILLFPRLINLARTHRIKRTFTSQTLINAMLGFLKKMGFYKYSKIIVRESNSIFHLLKGHKLKRYSLAYKIGYSNVDLVICQTDFMKKQLLDGMPWMKENLKLIVLPNPINLELIRKKEREKLPQLANKKFLVAAGRLVPAKGFDLLLHSFAKLRNEYPNMQLLILGKGPERSNLVNLIQSLDLSVNVELIGFVNNVYPYFKAAELCVMSSRIEGFPNVLLQMMSQNTKVVSTLSAGGINELPGIFTCDTENIDQLTIAIRKCLQNDTSKNRKLFDKNLNQRTVKKFIDLVVEQVN